VSPSPRSIAASFALLVVLIVGIGAASYLISRGQSKVYQSTGVVRFQSEHPELQLVGLQPPGNNPDDRIIGTDVLLANSPDIVSHAAVLLGVSPGDVRSHIAISPQPGANAVALQAHAGTAQSALRYASDYINAMIATRRATFYARAQDVVRQVRAQIALLEGTNPRKNHPFTVNMHNQVAAERALQAEGYGAPEVLKAPQLPSSVASPKSTRNALFGALFGLLLGVALISLLFRARRAGNGRLAPREAVVAQAPPPPAATVGSDAGDDWHRRP